MSFADAHYIYISLNHLSRRLRNITTLVQCSYIPIPNLSDVLRV